MALKTPEQAKMDADEFAAGYATDLPKTPEPTDDEAFGLTEPAAAPTPPEAPAAPAEEPAVAEAAPEAPAMADAESGGEGASATAAEPEADEPTDPAEIQRMKSWEGRLRAREAELKALEAKLKDSTAEASAEGETAAHEMGEPTNVEKVEDVAEQVQSGDLTMEQAMKVLASDFGEDFTKMLDVLITAKASEIAGKTADEKVAGVSSKLDSLESGISEDRTASHFESIEDMHPDFREIGASQEFKDWVDAMPATDKEQAVATINGGRARAINKLLSSYKDSMKAPAQDTPDEGSMDAAEGVRAKSSLKLPEPASDSQGYEDAWKNF